MNTTTTGPLIKNALRVRQRSLACVVRELHTSRRSLHGTTATRFMASAAMASASAAPSKYSALEQQVKKIYLDRFPCTLHYYSSRGPKLHLFDRRKLLERERAHGEAEGEEDEDPHRLGQDAVPVDDQGQIDLRGGQALPPWPGAALHPNTNVRLEITRSWIEWAEECRTARGQDVATPWFFTIPKGTPLPSHLWLIHEDQEDFHLLQREPTSLHLLNQELNDFFGSHGSQVPEKEWHDKYFLEGYQTHEEKDWMSR